MEISNTQYAKGLFEVLKDLDEKAMQAPIKKFVGLLASHNKLSQIDKILSSFVELWSRERGIVKAEIVSAKELSNDVLSALNKYIVSASSASQVEVKEKIDPSIIGGVIVRRDDKILDMSIKNKLQEMRNKLRD